MAGRGKSVFDVREMVRRFRAGEGDRAIARDLRISRNTVKVYRAFAVAEGFLAATDPPTAEALAARLDARRPEPKGGPSSTLEPWRAFVAEQRSRGVELVALHALLRERGFAGSYSALRRFVRRLEPRTPEVFVRVETAPGEEAQVDFGYAGPFVDPATGKARKAWVFVMTLGYSRHQYAELVFDQRVETWVALHVRAFRHFGGIPRRVVIDNLKAAITAAAWDDPEVQRTYRDLAEHAGFLISPCRPRTPQHKGKVESGVRYVARNALAGRAFKDVVAANEHLLRWIAGTAGVRDHGTTRRPPLETFESREKAALLPLPSTEFVVATWREAKVHRDGHLVVDGSFYSAPCRLVGETVWCRVTPDAVELYERHVRVATHPRAKAPGGRATLAEHLPPGKRDALVVDPETLRRDAAAVGARTAEFVDRLLGDRPLDRRRGARRVLTLATRWGAARVEAACARALAFDEVRAASVESILQRGRGLAPAERPSVPPAPPGGAFVRRPEEYVRAAASSW